MVREAEIVANNTKPATLLHDTRTFGLLAVLPLLWILSYTPLTAGLRHENSVAAQLLHSLTNASVLLEEGHNSVHSGRFMITVGQS